MPGSASTPAGQYSLSRCCAGHSSHSEAWLASFLSTAFWFLTLGGFWWKNSVNALPSLTLTCFLLAYSCMRKHFAPHAAGPVVCLKSPMETAGLGFQPMLQLRCLCVWFSTVTGVTHVWHAKPSLVAAAVALSLIWPLSGSTRTVISRIVLPLFNSVKARKAVLTSWQCRTGPVEMLWTDKGQEVAECLWLFGLSPFPLGNVSPSSQAKSSPWPGGTVDWFLMCGRQSCLRGPQQFIQRILNDLMAILFAQNYPEGISVLGKVLKMSCCFCVHLSEMQFTVRWKCIY